MKKTVSVSFVQLFLVLTPFFAGLFYEAFACLASVVMLVFLLVSYRKQGALQVPRGPVFFVLLFLVGSYAVSILWATDRGMAVFGALKLLPLPLFSLVLAQYPAAHRQGLLPLIPLSGGLMTVLSLLLGQISALRSVFFVNSRLGGFFLYPNTFALFLLLGAVILLTAEAMRPRDWLLLALLFTGIALSGSRTVFLLLLLFGVWGLFRLPAPKTRLGLGCGLLGLLAATLLYAAVSGDLSAAARYLTISPESSTLLGRLLYLQDALPVIGKHPFGLGYLGYAFSQGSFQTGVYSVTYIHNEFFQLLLDVGWLPALLCLWTLLQLLRPGKCDLCGRCLLLVIIVHSLVDFDLQFPVIGFVLLLAVLPCQTLSCEKKLLPAAAAILSVACLYFAVVSGLYSAGAYNACAALYPGHTNAQLVRLQQADDAGSMEAIADRILEVNPSVSLAWSAKARVAHAQGHVSRMISCKEQALALARYSVNEYVDYFRMLYDCHQLYLQNGDPSSAEICRQKLLEIPKRMDAVLAQTSSLGWRIHDKPQLTLPDSCTEILARLR